MTKGVYRVAGPDLTDRRDCNVYALDGERPVLIDSRVRRGGGPDDR